MSELFQELSSRPVLDRWSFAAVFLFFSVLFVGCLIWAVKNFLFLLTYLGIGIHLWRKHRRAIKQTRKAEKLTRKEEKLRLAKIQEESDLKHQRIRAEWYTLMYGKMQESQGKQGVDKYSWSWFGSATIPQVCGVFKEDLPPWAWGNWLSISMCNLVEE